MWYKIMMMIVRNMVRSKTRLAATALGCGLAAFVTCFFLAAEYSMRIVTEAAGRDANIIVRQKDRY